MSDSNSNSHLAEVDLSSAQDGGLLACQADCAPVRNAECEQALDLGDDVNVLDSVSEISSKLREERAGQTSANLSHGQRIAKRSLDLLTTLVILPLLFPLALVIALAIKFDSRGPILFWQERIGRDNQRFQIVKFRTMRPNAPSHAASSATARKDPRVTRLGAFLRQTSLDELPQFFNVLMGDMSIVGPRPHTEATTVGDKLLWEIEPNYFNRHVVKPGITGLAQVRGHRGSLFSEEQFRARFEADLEYIEDWSMTADLMIMLRTAGILVHRNAF